MINYSCFTSIFLSSGRRGQYRNCDRMRDPLKTARFYYTYLQVFWEFCLGCRSPRPFVPPIPGIMHTCITWVPPVERTTWKNNTWMSSSLAIIDHSEVFLTERILLHFPGLQRFMEKESIGRILGFHEQLIFGIFMKPTSSIIPQLCICGSIYNNGNTCPS